MTLDGDEEDGSSLLHFLFSELVNLHFNKSITRIVINPATGLNHIFSSNTKEKAISAENA